MELYRALDRLSIGVKHYEVFPAARLRPDAARILLQKRKIVEVQTPPLAIVLPEHAAQWQALGITEFSELFELDGYAELKAAALDVLQPSQCVTCYGGYDD